MELIKLQHTLPKVFVGNDLSRSHVWQQDVTFEKQKVYLIEANSGTGKSSLCSYIFGYRKDYEGKILFDDIDISRLKTSQWVDIRKHSLSLLWQELRLFPELTTMENIEIKNKLTGFKSKQQITDWLEQLGIADKRDAKIGRMSFGQQQRVALVRSLCQPFDFIFVDEPISHLDDMNSAIVGQLLKEEATRQGAGIIVTSIGKHIEMDYDKVMTL